MTLLHSTVLHHMPAITCNYMHTYLSGCLIFCVVQMLAIGVKFKSSPKTMLQVASTVATSPEDQRHGGAVTAVMGMHGMISFTFFLFYCVGTSLNALNRLGGWRTSYNVVVHWANRHPGSPTGVTPSWKLAFCSSVGGPPARQWGEVHFIVFTVQIRCVFDMFCWQKPGDAWLEAVRAASTTEKLLSPIGPEALPMAGNSL